MPKKGPSGEGTVRWHKSGLCEARLPIPKHLRAAYGGKTYLSFYDRQEGKALEKRAAARRDMEDGYGPRSGDLTVAQYLRRWIDGPLRDLVSERTYQDYAYYSEKHLIPDAGVGEKGLRELTAEDLDDLYARLTRSGVGPRAVNHVHSTIRVALQRAVKKRLIPYNPARDADPPRYSTDERQYLTLSMDDVGAFFEAAAGDRFEALFVVAVLSGPRPAEIRALKWSDLDLPDLPGLDGEARIRRTVTELKGRGPVLRNTTKTGKHRPVHLFPEVVAALKAHRKRYLQERVMHAAAWESLWAERPDLEDLVFPSISGGIMLRSNLGIRHFKPILAKAGLPKEVRLYDLRHTFATLWVESGEDLKVLQEILGHSRYETTANRYVHPSRRAHKEAMVRFGQRFRRPG